MSIGLQNFKFFGMSCLFCRIVKKEIPSQFVYEDEQMVVFKDVKPKARVHLLIVPKKHIDSIAALTKEDINLVGQLIWQAKKIAEEFKIAKSGYKLIFNTGLDSGQAINHLHLHLLGGERMEWIV